MSFSNHRLEVIYTTAIVLLKLAFAHFLHIDLMFLINKGTAIFRILSLTFCFCGCSVCL